MDKRSVISNFKTEALANTTFAAENFSNLTDAQLNWKPEPNRWSIAQCFEHINITTRHWNVQVLKVAANGKKSDNRGEYKRTGIGGFLLKSLINPKPRKFKTFKKLLPPSDLDCKMVIQNFVSLQKEWESTMEKIQGFDLDRNRVSSPVSSLITYRLGNAIELNNVHTHRHLNQAMNVKKMEGFPKS